jgi:hypothetical protein
MAGGAKQALPIDQDEWIVPYSRFRQSMESVGCAYIEQRVGQKNKYCDQPEYNSRAVVQRDSVRRTLPIV